ncbi:hypothetical protein PINS_up006090 [Pythium insidiosum]|nr:hypothetical protein PINS_up006090 [Pythium insidiosum]
MTDIEKENDDEEEESAEYKGHELKYMSLRIVMIALLTLVSVVLKDHFLDLTDFVGASGISLCYIILPIQFYFKKMWTQIPVWEKAAGSLVVIVCFLLSVYVSYKTGKNLFSPVESKPTVPKFPFCAPEFEFELYYNATAANN